MKNILKIVLPITLTVLLIAGLLLKIHTQKIYIQKLEAENKEQYEQELSTLSAEELAKEYSSCKDEHKHMKYALAQDWKNELPKSFGKDNIEYWHLIKIKEIPVDNEHQNPDMYDIKNFWVEGEVKWKNEKKAPHHSGTFTWIYTLTKPTENDRWYVTGDGFP